LQARLHPEPRFPPSEIASLLDHHPTHNLAESTSLDLSLAELLDTETIESLRGVEMGYGTAAGDPEFRSLIASSLGVQPEQALITQGAIHALFLVAIERCRGPQDEAIILRPSFPPGLDTLRASHATIHTVPLRFSGGYRLEFDAIERTLSGRTRIVSLAMPQNPSGVRFDREEIAQLTDLIERRAPQATLIVDQTYREAVYEGEPPGSVAPLDPRIVVTGSVSKAHRAPALRTGWLATRDDTLLGRCARGKFNTVSCAPTVDERLALRVVQRAPDILGARRRLLAENLRTVEAFSAANAHLVEWVKPGGGGLCCFRMRKDAITDPGGFFDSLGGWDLAVAPGRWFGDEPRVFRVGFGSMPSDALHEALAVLGSALEAAAARS